jgi:hypothetical protein
MRKSSIILTFGADAPKVKDPPVEAAPVSKGNRKVIVKRKRQKAINNRLLYERD